jgi:hypothetical protein
MRVHWGQRSIFHADFWSDFPDEIGTHSEGLDGL